MTVPASPAITTQSFQGEPFPPEVASQVLNMLTGGAPFANSVSRYPTDRSAVAFPTAAPDRPGWLPEMGLYPIANLNDDANVVGVAKLGTIILLSNESVDDASISLVAELQNLLRDSASAELDRGVLYGEGAGQHEPSGVVAAAPPSSGADLAAALTDAIGSVGDAGGNVTHLAARPSVLAAARNARDEGGQFVYPGGIGQALGVEEVGVPELEPGDMLAFDASRVWLVIRDDFSVDLDSSWAFQRDAVAVRIRGRFAIAAPLLHKSIRRLQIGGGENGEGRGAAAAPRTGRTERRSESRP